MGRAASASAVVVLAAALLTVAGLTGAPVRAQAIGDPRAGAAVARAQCAGCHAVERGNRKSVEPRAPAFQVIAEAPGTSPIALNVILNSAHHTMPNIVLRPADRRDVIAYIISLQPR
jgi:cytochrome c